MRSSKIRLLTVLLALLLVGTLLVGCTEPVQPPVDGGTDNGDDGGDQGGDDPLEGQDIPDYLMQVEQRDLDRTVTIMGREGLERETYIEEEAAASLLEKGVFSRNARVEEYLNIEIAYMPVPGNWANQSVFMSTVRNSTAAYDDAFQIVFAFMGYNAQLALDSQYYNLCDLDSLQMDAPWWSESFVENAVVDDTVFFLMGDLSLTMWENMYATFFNRAVAQEYADLVGDLYETARDGDWTLEELLYLSSSMYVDDGDDVRDAEDTYGFAATNFVSRLMVTSCDIPIASQNEDGLYYLSMMDKDNAERTQQVYVDVWNLVFENPGATGDLMDDAGTIFTEGRALFFMEAFGTASTKLREVELDYGILPTPKYDDEQEDYRTHAGDGSSALCIPRGAHDPEACALVLDALAADNKRAVIPAYYDVILKGRTAQDAESAEMIDLIRDKLYYDFGFIYSDALKGGSVSAGPFAYFGDCMVLRGQDTFASSWASAVDVFEDRLEQVMDLLTGKEE